MPTFTYTAKDKKGSKVEGTMDADARSAVVSRLQQMGYFPMSVQQVAKGAGKAAAKAVPAKGKTGAGTVKKAPAKGATAAPPPEGFRLRKGVRASDLANFNRQLADLIGAGIPLVKGLALLNKQTSNEELRGIISTVLDDVQSGATFADALAKHPKVFSKLYVAMVKSGEAGGMLHEVLVRLADYSENEEQLKSKVKSALTYPLVMVIAGSGAVLVMFGYVVPKITGTFEQMGQALPAITQLLITMSHMVQNYWWMLLAGAFVVAALLYQFVKSPEGRAMWDRFVLRVPILGLVVQKRQVARFTRTLGSLLRNGVSILTALDIVREVVDNSVVKADVERVIEDITQGASIATPLRESPVFPPVAINMIAIGEETGNLSEVLLRIADSYESQSERTIRDLTNLIEPLIIVAMGLIVGFIVIAMLLPIFSLDPTGGSV